MCTDGVDIWVLRGVDRVLFPACQGERTEQEVRGTQKRKNGCEEVQERNRPNSSDHSSCAPSLLFDLQHLAQRPTDVSNL
jgi:hypothetical protein